MKVKIVLTLFVVVGLGLVLVGCGDLLGLGSVLDDGDEADNSDGNGATETDNGRDHLADVAAVTVFDTLPGWNFSTADDGRVWTNNGLGVAVYTYDTNQWTQYNADTVEAIREPDEGKILATGDEVWISYGWAGDGEHGPGITRWNPEAGTYTHFEHGITENFPRGPVWEVTEDPDSNIWVGTRWEVGAAHFDGTVWTQVSIEGFDEQNGYRYFDCNSIKHDSAGNTYFSTWRGGLHIRNSAGEWIHSDKGSEDGTESFLNRYITSSDLAFTPDGSEIYVATRPGSDEFVEEPDGVWKFDGSQWNSLTEGVGEARGAVLDERGYLWSTFTTDFRLRYYDGTDWVPADLGEYQPSDADFLYPIHVDGDYLWLNRYRSSTESQIVRYTYREDG